MAGYTHVFTDTKTTNWLKACLALKIVKEGLATFVTTEIQKMHTHVGGGCGNCSIENVLDCPTPKICNKTGNYCRFHKSQQYGKCQACVQVRKHIISVHRFGYPSWKNTKPEKWNTNAWQIAKCFLPPDGYADIISVQETDFNGLISILLNCKEFDKWFSFQIAPKSPAPKCRLTEARAIGSQVRHNPDIDVTDSVLESYFQTLNALLVDPQYLVRNPDCMTASKRLIELKENRLAISEHELHELLKDAQQILNNAKKEGKRLSDQLNSALNEIDLRLKECLRILDENTRILDEKTRILDEKTQEYANTIEDGVNRITALVGRIEDSHNTAQNDDHEEEQSSQNLSSLVELRRLLQIDVSNQDMKQMFISIREAYENSGVPPVEKPLFPEASYNYPDTIENVIADVQGITGVANVVKKCGNLEVDVYDIHGLSPEVINDKMAQLVDQRVRFKFVYRTNRQLLFYSGDDVLCDVLGTLSLFAEMHQIHDNAELHLSGNAAPKLVAIVFLFSKREFVVVKNTIIGKVQRGSRDIDMDRASLIAGFLTVDIYPHYVSSCFNRFLNELGEEMDAKLLTRELLERFQHSNVHIWTKRSSPGLGILSGIVKSKRGNVLLITERHENQRFAQTGDSGAMVLACDDRDQSLYLVGLLVGEFVATNTTNSRKTYAVSPLWYVLERLGQLHDSVFDLPFRRVQRGSRGERTLAANVHSVACSQTDSAQTQSS